MFLQLRITIDPSGNRSKTNVLNLLKAFMRLWVKHQDASANATCGFEKLNKFGEPCNPHFHLNVHMTPPDLVNPLRSAKEFLRKRAIANEYRLAGNPVWSCTMVEEPNDYDRWIRYPLKELPVPSLCTAAGNLEFTFAELAHDAKTERKRSVELNLIKRAKAIDKCSHRDKLFAYLDDLFSDSDPPGHKPIWITILSYYMDQGKSVCYQTINGYTILYQLHIKTLTPDQAYATAFRNT